MRLFAILFTLAATPAHAHLGHVGELAGHGHWIGLGALGAAALAAWLSGKGKRADAEAEPEEDAEPEEAEA